MFRVAVMVLCERIQIYGANGVLLTAVICMGIYNIAPFKFVSLINNNAMH